MNQICKTFTHLLIKPAGFLRSVSCRPISSHIYSGRKWSSSPAPHSLFSHGDWASCQICVDVAAVMRPIKVSTSCGREGFKFIENVSKAVSRKLPHVSAFLFVRVCSGIYWAWGNHYNINSVRGPILYCNSLLFFGRATLATAICNKSFGGATPCVAVAVHSCERAILKCNS